MASTSSVDGATTAAAAAATDADCVVATELAGVLATTIQEAVRSVKAGNGPFAAAVVLLQSAVAGGSGSSGSSGRGDRDTVQLLALECNAVLTSCDPTAHAEVQAIRAACQQAGVYDLRYSRWMQGQQAADTGTGTQTTNPPVTHPQRQVVLVSSCYPCPMCAAAAAWAGVSTVVYGAEQSAAAAAGFDDRAVWRSLQHGYAASVKGEGQGGEGGCRPLQLVQLPLPGVDVTAPFRQWNALRRSKEHRQEEGEEHTS